MTERRSAAGRARNTSSSTASPGLTGSGEVTSHGPACASLWRSRAETGRTGGIAGLRPCRASTTSRTATLPARGSASTPTGRR